MSYIINIKHIKLYKVLIYTIASAYEHLNNCVKTSKHLLIINILTKNKRILT